MKTLFLILALGLALAADAANLRFEWDPSADASVTGYKLYIGTNDLGTNGNLSSWAIKVIDCGCATNGVWTNAITGQTCYAVVTAYNAVGLESDPSNVVQFRVPASPLLRPPRSVSVLAWLESAGCLEGPWTLLCGLGETAVPLDADAQFFRARAVIQR